MKRPSRRRSSPLRLLPTGHRAPHRTRADRSHLPRTLAPVRPGSSGVQQRRQGLGVLQVSERLDHMDSARSSLSRASVLREGSEAGTVSELAQRLSRLHPNQGIVVREQGQEQRQPFAAGRPSAWARFALTPASGYPSNSSKAGTDSQIPSSSRSAIAADRSIGAVPAEGDQRRDLCPSVHSLIPCWPSSRGSRGPSGSR